MCKSLFFLLENKFTNKFITVPFHLQSVCVKVPWCSVESFECSGSLGAMVRGRLENLHGHAQ